MGIVLKAKREQNRFELKNGPHENTQIAVDLTLGRNP